MLWLFWAALQMPWELTEGKQRGCSKLGWQKAGPSMQEVQKRASSACSFSQCFSYKRYSSSRIRSQVTCFSMSCPSKFLSPNLYYFLGGFIIGIVWVGLPWCYTVSLKLERQSLHSSSVLMALWLSACSLEKIVRFYTRMEAKEIISTLHQSHSLYLYIKLGAGSIKSCFFLSFFLADFHFWLFN